MTKSVTLDDRKCTTYYVTKYWATKGIWEVQGYRSASAPTMLVFVLHDGVNGVGFAHGRDFHASLSDAYADLRRRAEKRIKTLQKQIDKITKLDIEAMKPVKIGVK